MRLRNGFFPPAGFCLAMAAVLAVPVAAQPAPAPSPAPLFISVDTYLDSGGIKLANGKAADADDWKAIALWLAPTMNCTAALVGRQVVLTSAHCLDASQGVGQAAPITTATARFNDRDYPLVDCTMHPDYLAGEANGNFPRSGRDYALCAVQYPVDGIAFETLTPSSLESGKVVLMGFGCYGLAVVNGKVHTKLDSGKPTLRLGDQVIESAGQSLATSGATLSRTVSRNAKEPNICPGDSGGPVLTGITGSAPKAGRRISGLNSAFHGRWGGEHEPPIFYSYLAPTGSAFFGWARKWADDRKLIICGIQRDAGLGGCRN